MKTKTWAVLIAALLILCLAGSIALLLPRETADMARIIIDGEPVKTLDLSINQQLTLDTYRGGRNVVTVKDGKIAVTQANCPDHHCMARGFCNSGTPIVCLPNRLVIEFMGQQEVDISLG